MHDVVHEEIKYILSPIAGALPFSQFAAVDARIPEVGFQVQLSVVAETSVLNNGNEDATNKIIRNIGIIFLEIICFTY